MFDAQDADDRNRVDGIWCKTPEREGARGVTEGCSRGACRMGRRARIGLGPSLPDTDSTMAPMPALKRRRACPPPPLP
ncbi:hypothetical protein AO398_22495 [Methylobacterium sp. GXS13]|nr:hypothetical protein AO398_22495 [Methylobacterium sp. GXS13]